MHLLTFRGVNCIFSMKIKKKMLIKTGISKTKNCAKDVDQIYVQHKSISNTRMQYQEIELIPVRQNTINYHGYRRHSYQKN